MQEQAEALVRLLIMARYEDRTLSIAENHRIEAVVNELEWDSGTALSVFIQTATAEVREAMAESFTKQEFLEQQCAVFVEQEDRKMAYHHLRSVLESDGMDPDESRLLERVQKLLQL